LPHSRPWAITELRQSTTVPNVSNTHAFTLASSGFTFWGAGAAGCAKAGFNSESDIAAAPAPAATRKFRRSTLIPMNASFKAESRQRKGAASRLNSLDRQLDGLLAVIIVRVQSYYAD